MSVFDKIKDMSAEEAGSFLCNTFEMMGMDCDTCPVQNLCSLGSNGFAKFLKQEDKKCRN